MAFSIPTELLERLRERRVIPFVGAGFSAALNLPGWEQLLRGICAETKDTPSFDDIYQCCQGDYLQIAEYFYLKHDRNVGPLRHTLTSLLRPVSPPTSSTAHVELVNLNAQQIYTTNYDELIERTFFLLGHPAEIVALPKHIATANRSKTHVVKYHGDLRYDNTLVLTESSYYNRLEFESPMDLKFRSDLLGRSVLFIGYSFRDINIRIIWFRLMEMMRDVPAVDRPSSFIVRLEKNEVLEELYQAVGIKTIYLDSSGAAKTAGEKNHLLGRFMLELAMQTSEEGRMPGQDVKMFISTGLIQEIRSALTARRSWFSRTSDPVAALIAHATGRSIPIDIQGELDTCLGELATAGMAGLSMGLALNALEAGLTSTRMALCLFAGFCSKPGRSKLLLRPPLWEKFWSVKMNDTSAEFVIKLLYNEMHGHETEQIDDDLAYACAVVKQIESGLLVAETSPMRQRAQEAIKAAAKLYSSVADIQIFSDRAPVVDKMLQEIDQATPKPEIPEFDDDIPF